MTSTPTGGTETILQLTRAVERHRGDFPAWQRTGGQLVVQRTLLGYPNGKRQRFVDERVRPPEEGGLTYKNIYELEHGPRWGKQAFPVHWLMIAADAYEVALESFAASLDGGELVPASASPRAPGTQAARGSAPVPLAAIAPPAVWDGLRMSGVPAESVITAAAPQATAILLRLIALAAEGKVRPAGCDVFEGDDDASRAAARRWDRLAEDMPDYDMRAWYVATKAVTETVTEAAGPQLDMNVG